MKSQVFSLLILTLFIGSCDEKIEPSRVTIAKNGGKASAITLDRARYATTKTSPATGANTEAKFDQGKHKLTATIDDAGPGLKVATASAKHLQTQADADDNVL